MFGYKLIKKNRLTELLKKENALGLRSKAYTFKDLSTLKAILIKEINNVEYRLRQIQATYYKLRN